MPNLILSTIIKGSISCHDVKFSADLNEFLKVKSFHSSNRKNQEKKYFSNQHLKNLKFWQILVNLLTCKCPNFIYQLSCKATDVAKMLSYRLISMNFWRWRVSIPVKRKIMRKNISQINIWRIWNFDNLFIYLLNSKCPNFIYQLSYKATEVPKFSAYLNGFLKVKSSIPGTGRMGVSQICLFENY